MWRSYINILVILVILAAVGNYTPAWAAAKDFLPTGLEIGFDVARLPYYLWREKTGAQYEFHTSIDFNRILLDIDYGLGNILRKNPTKSKEDPEKKFSKVISDHWGQYFRLGLGYNFIPPNKAHHVAYLGFMYTRSSFQDALYGNYYIDNPKYTSKTKLFQYSVDIDVEDKFHAHWLEVVAGVRVPLWQWVYMGCTVRYKFAKHVSSSPTLIPFDIIGWGLQEEDDAWGVNYYIGIRIPLPSLTSQPSTTPPKSNQP
jgi:hypothetical protein